MGRKSDWRSRLILEEKELSAKYRDLKIFIDTNEQFEGLEQEDRHLLLLQAHYMQGYLKILDERLKKIYPNGIIERRKRKREQSFVPSEGHA